MTSGNPPGESLAATAVPAAVAVYRSASRIYDWVLEPPLRNMRRAVCELAGDISGLRVLDVCCGTGVQARRFADSGARVVGADLSPHMLIKALGRGTGNMRFVLTPADALPFADDSFDLVFMSLALHETPEPLRLSFAGEMNRVARPGGRVMVMDYAVPRAAGATALLYRNAYHLAERLAGGAHYRNYRHWMSRGGLHGFAGRSVLGGGVTEYYGGAMGVLTATVS